MESGAGKLSSCCLLSDSLANTFRNHFFYLSFFFFLCLPLASTSLCPSSFCIYDDVVLRLLALL